MFAKKASALKFHSNLSTAESFFILSCLVNWLWSYASVASVTFISTYDFLCNIYKINIFELMWSFVLP
jgi:hypothetical protein